MRTQPLVRIVVASVLFLLASAPAVYASYTSTRSGQTATMVGSAAADILTITQESGLFVHSRFDDLGFESAADFDSTQVGVQMVSSSTGIIHINAGAGNDTILLGVGVDLRGTIDGGGDVDTLSYAARTESIRANLGLSTLGMEGTFGGDQENPPTTNQSTGMVSIGSYNLNTRTFDITVSVSGVPAAAVIGFHIHRAAPGVNGPIIIDFGTGSLTPLQNGFSFSAGGVVLGELDEAAFLSGATYVNVHTASFPNGAIRAQLFSTGNASLGSGRASGTTSVTSIENVVGGSGGDSLVGNAFANALVGGGGADWLLGGPEDDILDGEAGGDLLGWNHGDGWDVLDGGADGDTVLVNCDPNGDVLGISANGTRLSIAFSAVLDIGTIETLTINGLGGSDGMTFNDVTGVASLTNVNLNGFGGNDIVGMAPASPGNVELRVHGGTGIDTLGFANLAALTFNVTAAGHGNIPGLVTAFSFVESLYAGNENDTFNVQGASGDGSMLLGGGGGSDTLNYEAASLVTFGDTIPPDGYIGTSGGGTFNFGDIETINILNPRPTISVGDVTVSEGASPPTAAFAVTLSNPSLLTVGAHFSTLDISAVAPADYQLQDGDVTFLPGDVVKFVSVPLVVDTLAEPAETFQLFVYDGVNASIADGQAIGTILDNTAPTISAIANVTIQAGSSTPALPFTVGDAQMPAGSLLVTASSSDPGLVVQGGLELGGSGASRTLVVTPVGGAFGQATITVTVSDGAFTASTSFVLTVQPTTVQPPTDLYVSAMAGTDVTFRFNPATLGPAPTGFVLEGGLAPGQVLASLPTGSDAPIFTITAPTGTFYVRMHATRGSDRSAASNEIRIHVNVPVPPSSPDMVSIATNGNHLVMAWRNTFGGGAPASLVLDVTGGIVAQLSLGLFETLSVGASPGTYTLRLRALNAGGSSPPSLPVTVTFPTPCPGPPATPSNFLAYRIGRTIYVVWDPPASGPAASHYVLNVAGSYVGSFTIPARTISGQVGPGSYTLNLSAVNPCGTGPATPTQTVVVP